MVRFRDGKPTGIYFSQHRDGAAYSWDDTTVSKRDGRVSGLLCHGRDIQSHKTPPAYRLQRLRLARKLSGHRVSNYSISKRSTGTYQVQQKQDSRRRPHRLVRRRPHLGPDPLGLLPPLPPVQLDRRPDLPNAPAVRLSHPYLILLLYRPLGRRGVPQDRPQAD